MQPVLRGTRTWRSWGNRRRVAPYLAAAPGFSRTANRSTAVRRGRGCAVRQQGLVENVTMVVEHGCVFGCLDAGEFGGMVRSTACSRTSAARRQRGRRSARFQHAAHRSRLAGVPRVRGRHASSSSSWDALLPMRGHRNHCLGGQGARDAADGNRSIGGLEP